MLMWLHKVRDCSRSLLLTVTIAFHYIYAVPLCDLEHLTIHSSLNWLASKIEMITVSFRVPRKIK